MFSTRRQLLCVVITALLSGHVFAADPPAVSDALPAQSNKASDAGVWNAAFRYRYEGVSDDAFARDADASTARLRLGWRQPLASGFSIFVEGEGVAELGDHFNSTANRQVAYPVVPDARALELNQAVLAWQDDTSHAALGRQRYVLDNQRFIGNVGWRQNEQTFDALSLDTKLNTAMTVRYAFLDRAHRVNGDEAIDPLAQERNLAAHSVNATYAHTGGALTGYGYFLKDQDVAAASTRTLGLRWVGNHAPDPQGSGFGWGWTLEFAQQSDYANNSANFSHNYILAEPTLSYSGITWRLGYERLGGNGRHALQTPLATLHAFNGWADKFLVTPNDGLEDRYVGAGAKFGSGAWQNQLNWALAYHDFGADQGSRDFGSEWDASVGAALGHGWSGLVKLADFRSDGYARDTQKIWFQLEWVH